MLAVLVSIKGKWGISFALTVFIVVFKPGTGQNFGFQYFSIHAKKCFWGCKVTGTFYKVTSCQVNSPVK
jgi:hypothetical protein